MGHETSMKQIDELDVGVVIVRVLGNVVRQVGDRLRVGVGEKSGGERPWWRSLSWRFCHNQIRSRVRADNGGHSPACGRGCRRGQCAVRLKALHGGRMLSALLRLLQRSKIGECIHLWCRRLTMVGILRRPLMLLMRCAIRTSRRFGHRRAHSNRSRIGRSSIDVRV